MKSHPIEIQEGGEYMCPPDGFWSKGHHEPRPFLEAVNAWLAKQSWAYRHEWAGVSELGPEYEDKVRHDWLRFVPELCDVGVGGYMDAEPHARGAFPVTTVWF